MPRASKKVNTSGLYDEALPKNLQYEGVVERAEDRLRINKRKKIPLSPYIIHLAEEEKSESTAEKIEELAQQLQLEAKMLASESTEQTIEELSIDFNQLIEQMREPDVQLDQKSIKASEKLEDEPVLVFPSVATRGFTEDKELQREVRAIAEPEPGPQGQVRITPVGVAPTQEPEVQIKEVLEHKETQAQRRGWQWPKFNWPGLTLAHHRAFAAFVLLALVIVLPLQIMQGAASAKSSTVEISDAGRNAIDNLMRGAAALEGNRFDVAENDFARATQDFSDAEASLNSMHSSIATIVSVLPQTEKTYDSVSGLITAGKNLSSAASQLADAAEEIQDQESLNIVTKLQVLEAYIEAALPKVENAAAALEQVDPSVIPIDYKDIVIELQASTPQLAQSMNEFVTFSQTLSTILGENDKMRYLLAFQNNTELRPTGGFIGSFAELDLLNGEIDSMHVPQGGSYDVQGQLSAFVASPKPIALINPRWEFQDSNWFPDFPTSAKKMMWFYEQSGGPTVDGVITVNATFMPKLLEILGPIEMPEYGRTIDSENFLFETQKIVEIEYEDYDTSADNRTVPAPKQFIGDLAPKIIEKLEAADLPTMLAVLDLVGEALVEKDLMFYFDDNALQSQMEQLGWSGAIKPTSGDYLMVVNTNLGGGKTDTVIEQGIDLVTTIEDDGSIINTVTITKEHLGMRNALFEGANNVDYIRLYVPRGSELLRASGFEIPDDDLFEAYDGQLSYDEDLALLMSDIRKDAETETDIWVEKGKTVFGNWIQTAPGETEIVKFTYRLPWKIDFEENQSNLIETVKEKLGLKDLTTYTVFIQKQPGVVTRETNVSLSLPKNLNIIWSSHAGKSAGENIILTNENDNFLRFLMEDAL